MHESILEKIGLTKGEIKVYITLLKLGETTTGKIIEGAGISSGKIYEILDKLIKKGLVSYGLKEKTKYFTATHPSRILDFLKEKEEELKEKEKEIQEILPRLIELKEKKEEEYSVTLYRGLKGLKSAIYEALNDLTREDVILVSGVQSGKSEAQNILWKQWNKERARKRIKCKLIFSDRNTQYYHSLKKVSLTEVRVLSSLVFSTIDVMGKRVMIFNNKEPSVIVIINEEIKKKFIESFESLWKMAKA